MRALIVSGHPSERAVVAKMFDDTIAGFGRIDIVINNAGVIVKKPLVDVTEDELDRCFAVNAKAPFFVMQESARRIEDNGRVINIGTTIVGATIPGYSCYAGSKAPLEQFTRALAKEIGHRGVTVNVVAPGPVDTPFFRGPETPESIARVSEASVTRRLGQVEDIVPLIEFLASPASQWITGQTLFINGRTSFSSKVPASSAATMPPDTNQRIAAAASSTRRCSGDGGDPAGDPPRSVAPRGRWAGSARARTGRPA